MSAVAAFTSPVGIRRVLWLDAITGAGSALLSLAAPGPGFGHAGPVAPAGAGGGRAGVGLCGLGRLALGNAAWVLASVELVLAGPGLTALGMAYVLAQAALVAVLATLQWQASRA